MAKYQNGGDEVKKKWWPEAGEDIRCDSGQQNNDSKGKPVFNYQVVKFHTNCLIGPKDKAQGTRHKVQARLKVQGTRYKVQGTRKIKGTRLKSQASLKVGSHKMKKSLRPTLNGT